MLTNVIIIDVKCVNYGEKPLVVSHKKLADTFRNNTDLDSSVEVGHFQGLRGSNEFEDCSVVFITGRNQPPTAKVDQQARALFWDDDLPLQHDDLEGNLPLERRGYWQSEDNPMDQAGVQVRGFSDPRIEAIHSQVREAETIQAVARLRLVRSGYHKQVFLLGNLPVEIPVDRLVAFNDLMPDKLERALILAGDFPLTAMGIVKMRPDLGLNEGAAGKALTRSNLLSLELLLKSHPEVSRAMVYIATFKAGDIRRTTHQHLFIPPISVSDQGMVLWKRQTDLEIKEKLEEGWGAVFDLTVEYLYKDTDGEP
ncbi:MAG: hypothetical protein ACI9HA_003546 [Dinoroseobacter sp.]|jgi:hypothetical protein